MEVERDPAEFARSIENGSGQAVTVWAEYRIRRGRVVPASTDVARYRFPLGNSGIVSDLAAVSDGDEDAALSFVEKWGLLGFERVGKRSLPASRVPEGDPLEWTWAHASGVRAFLGLAQALASRRRKALNLKDTFADLTGATVAPRELTHRRVRVNERVVSGVDALAAVDARTIGFCAGRVPVRFHVNPMDLEHSAREFIVQLLNTNEDGWAQRWQWLSTGELAVTREFDAPIRAVYYHLPDAVSRIRRCDQCGLPFIQTHGRQRFCPAEPYVIARGGESGCAMRFRTSKRKAGRLVR